MNKTIELTEERKKALGQARIALVMRSSHLSHRASTSYDIKQRRTLRTMALNAWHDARCLALMTGEVV